MSQSTIGTLVDRRSRYLRVVHLPDGHRADRCRQALEPVLASLPAAARLTLTWDQGSEMAHHDRLADLFAEGIFFAHLGSPWLRGKNGNTNGLSGSTSPRAATSGRSPRTTFPMSSRASTTAPARSSAGRHPPKSSPPPWHPDRLSVATVTGVLRQRLTTEAICAQGSWEQKDDPPFSGRKGSVRLAVVDGLVTADVALLLAGWLQAGEQLVLYGTAVDPTAQTELSQAFRGSRVRQVPQRHPGRLPTPVEGRRG
jgi:hypothetical protein